MARAFVCPGQGAQSIGMGKDLAEAYPAAMDIFNEVDEALGEKLSDLIWAGDIETLTLDAKRTARVDGDINGRFPARLRPRGLALRMRQWSRGIHWANIRRLAMAGAISVADTARLLRSRGEAMQAAVPVGVGAMAALLGLDFNAVQSVAAEAAAGEVCQAANDNDPGQVVVSGHKAAVERAVELAKERGAKRAVLLPVSAPFHCELMAPAAFKMKEALAAVNIQAPAVPVVSNVRAAGVSDPDEIRELLVQQVTGSVRWRESVMWMASQGVGPNLGNRGW